MTRLIETCMEGGPQTEPEIRRALAGHIRHDIPQAVLSWIEFRISCERQLSEVRGQDPQLRTEACAAAYALVTLRLELLEMLRFGTDQAEKTGPN